MMPIHGSIDGPECFDGLEGWSCRSRYRRTSSRLAGLCACSSSCTERLLVRSPTTTSVLDKPSGTGVLAYLLIGSMGTRGGQPPWVHRDREVTEPFAAKPPMNIITVIRRGPSSAEWYASLAGRRKRLT